MSWSKPELLPRWDGCIGCALSTDMEARDNRLPSQEHVRGCWLGRPGVVGPDDWRTSVFVEALPEQEENE